jgi:hypothetical protein
VRATASPRQRHLGGWRPPVARVAVGDEAFHPRERIAGRVGARADQDDEASRRVRAVHDAWARLDARVRDAVADLLDDIVEAGAATTTPRRRRQLHLGTDQNCTSVSVRSR